MRISYNWLKDFLPDLTATAQEVADALTMHSFEAVIAQEFSIDPSIQVVKILTIEPHPNADRLRLATVTNGTEEIRVVCGAPNITEGILVPFAPVGAKVLDKDGQFFELTKATIRGVESPGMLNSKRELGLSTDHDGIFILPADTPIGSKLIEHLPADTVIDCDITSNRAHDCLSHRGVAREVAALFGIAFKDVEKSELPAVQDAINGRTISVEDAISAPRYLNVVLEDITNGPSPLWLQARLFMMESRPISAAVDITNYVMFELGNPAHAFEANIVKGEIAVRAAKEGEEIDLLDGTKQSLTPEVLVIANDSKPVALAGIMGGQPTSVSNATNSIVLEVANFKPSAIRRGMQALNLRTDASARFIKAIDPTLVEDAAARLVQLFSSLTGATVVGVIDHYPNPIQTPVIPFHLKQAEKVAGTQISAEAAEQALTRLRFTVEKEDSVWNVTPATDRLDISAEHDVIEEVVRVFGLEHIPAKMRPEYSQAKPLSKELYWRETLRKVLIETGFTETYNYSFEAEKYAEALGMSKEGHLRIVNPISPQQAYLRTSLLPGLLANFVKNRAEFGRKISDVKPALFEIGHVYRIGSGDQVEGVIEEQYLSAMLLGTMETAKNLAEELLAVLHIEEREWVEIDHKEMPGVKVVQLKVNGNPIGMAGQLQAVVSRKVKFTTSPALFELNLDALITAAGEPVQELQSLSEIQEASKKEEPVQFRELAKYPSVYRDIAVLVEVNIEVEAVREVIERVGGEKVVKAILFDEYEQPDLLKKSLAFHIEYQDRNKTLTDVEIDALHKAIEASLAQELEAETR